MLSDVRAIAFDLDNTLWDVEPVLARAEAQLGEWLREHCPRIAASLSLEDMRRARFELAQREPHNAHDVTYLRLTALGAHARAHGYEEEVAQQAFAVFLAARNQVEPVRRRAAGADAPGAALSAGLAQQRQRGSRAASGSTTCSRCR